MNFPLFLQDFNKNGIFLTDFNENLIFATDFRKISKFYKKIRPKGAELFQADRRTDMTKIIVAFAQFCEKRLINAGSWNIYNAK